ncbi:MAG TPA: hypothetical protein VGX96_07340 [Candidatus Elarobacter sp.]|jgi:hypothetical protein|nr:hypothetical protein [Candidatus Elarobacter sp.]
MLLVGAIEACALYQGVRAVVSFRTARAQAGVDGANLRALSAIAFAALGAGAAFRYIGIALFVVLAAAYGWMRLRRAAPAHEPEAAGA